MREMVDGARRIGLTELGISDHYTLHPFESIEWSMPLHRLDEYVDELLAEAARSPELPLRLGIEADFFPETVDDLRERLQAHPFDYVIGSVHFLADFKVDSSATDWEALNPEEVN